MSSVVATDGATCTASIPSWRWATRWWKNTPSRSSCGLPTRATAMRSSRCLLRPGSEMGGRARPACDRCSGGLERRLRAVQKHERAFSCGEERPPVTFHSHCGEESTAWGRGVRRNRRTQAYFALRVRLLSGSAPTSLHGRRGRADAIDQLSPVRQPRGGDQRF
jgi:hypothetical protein